MSQLKRFAKISLRVLILILLSLFQVQTSVAQSWLSGWLYRSPITVTNSLSSALTNHQTQIILGSDFNYSYTKSDGSDIRITSSDGTTLIPYWIESWTQGASAIIWVKVPSIPASGNTTVFLYYGNESASSLSSGTNTFEFFDDFESGWSVTPHPSVWVDKSTIPTPSADATASVYNNKLYTFGGYGISHITLNTTYEYDPAADSWTYKSPMPTNRWGMVSVEFGGKIYVFGGQDRYGNGVNKNEIYDPISNTWTSTALENPLPVNDYGAEGVTHPDVIYFPESKDGYKYWMMYTPYPPTSSENPCIVRSNDGIRWTDAGITNPVIAKGESGSWNDQENPDPDFIYVSEINKWFMVWDGGDFATDSRKLALAYSSDGKTWTQYNGTAVNGNTNPVILSGTDNNGQAWEIDGFGHSQTCTPSLYYENGTFYLYYAEEASGNNRGRIGLATFTWNNSTNSISNLQRASGNPIIYLPEDALFKNGGGHLDVSKMPGSNTYYMYIVRELLGSVNYELSLLTSSSLTSGWTAGGKIIERGTNGQWDDTHVYRSCPLVNSSGEIVINDVNNTIRMFYSAFDAEESSGIGIADISLTDGSVTKLTGTGPQAMPAEISYQGLMGVSDGTNIHLFYKAYHYEYSPVSDTYTRITPDVPYPKTWATCAYVGGNIYLIGGYTDVIGSEGGTSENQMWNTSTNTWEIKAPCPRTRYGSTRENPVINGKIYATHGWNNYWFYTANYVYDPATNTWEKKGSANHARDGVACGVINNKLYVVGGRNVPSPGTFGIIWNEVYDPSADTWAPTNPPSSWTTSGANYVYTDETAKYQGNKGLVVRDPMDGSPGGLYSAETTKNFGTVFALDYNWNVTTLGGISEAPTTYPEVAVRLNSEIMDYGSLNFFQSNSPSLQWLRYPTFTTLQNSTWNSWHKVTIVRDGESSRVTFDGNQYYPLAMTPDGGDPNGPGKVRFGSIRTTQYIDNVRVRKWSGSDPVTHVEAMEALHGQWTGSYSTDWNNVLNWSDATIPDQNSNVNITQKSNQPVISTNSFCKNITIYSGASLQIQGTNTLTVNGNWINNGTFTANQSTVSIIGENPQVGSGVFYNLDLPGSDAKTFNSTTSIAGTLTSGTSIAFQPIIINSGASLTILPRGKASVSTLTNNGTLNLNSDATGTASLILDTYIDNGTENIQLFLTGGGNETDNNWRWHYISSPVASLAVSDITGTGAGASNNLAAYYESYATSTNQHSAWYGFDGWSYFTGTSGGPTFQTLEVGRGYNYYNSADATRTFGGSINTGSVSKTLSYTGASNNLNTKGWNLIGNPYTASISWDDLGKQSGIDNAVYFTKNNGFASYVNGVGTPSGTTAIIPPMQGFFVKTNESSRHIAFYPDIRIHSDQSRYKGDGETIPLIRLKIEGQNSFDEAVIRFNEKAKTSFDTQLDALKFSTTGTPVSLWTFIGTVDYSINSIPFPEIKTDVPVGINSSKAGTYVLTATQIQGLDNYNVYLWDKTTGNTVDLKTNQTINISIPEGIVADRFTIKISNTITDVDNPSIPEGIFNIYTSDNYVNIQTLSDKWEGKSGSIELIDISGRILKNVKNTEFWKNSVIQIPSKGYRGIYMVKILSGSMSYVGKLMIQ